MSIVPIPGLDFGVDIKLMREHVLNIINKIYGLDHKQVNTLGDDERTNLQHASCCVHLSVKKGSHSAVLK